MLRLIQAEFLKLRRKKFIVLMLLSALFMPLLAVFYFRSADKTVIEPLQFYKWTTFSYTAWIILPVVARLITIRPIHQHFPPNIFLIVQKSLSACTVLCFSVY